MHIKIENNYQKGPTSYFFEKQKHELKEHPSCVNVTVFEGNGANGVSDEVKENKKALITVMIINNKAEFEKASSAVLEQFVNHIKQNYPNLKSITGYTDKLINDLIKFNKVNENILLVSEKHVLIPKILQRINAHNSITIENKIQTLGHLDTFLQNATQEQLDQLATKISQLDQKPYDLSDLIKSISSITIGWVLGLGYLYMATRKLSDATAVGFIFGLVSIAGGSSLAYEYGVDFFNSSIEDSHYSEKDKITNIGTICSKM